MSISSSSSEQSEIFFLRDQLASYRQKLFEFPYDLGLRLQALSILRTLNETLQVAEERKLLSELFLLQEDFWMAWIDDEMASFQSGLSSASSLASLLESSCQDYVSTKLWLRLAQCFLQLLSEERASNATEPEFKAWFSFAYAKQVLAKGLTCIGYLAIDDDDNVGTCLFWDLCRKLESFAPVSANENIRALFQTQLTSLPSATVLKVFDSYIQWERGLNPNFEVPLPLQSLCKEKLSQFKKHHLNFMKNISETNHSLQSYLDYITHQSLSSSSNKTSLSEIYRASSLYEYAIKYHSSSSELWSMYIGFLREHLHLQDVLSSVLKRAIKLFPQSSLFSIFYLENMEYFNCNPLEIKEFFLNALSRSSHSVEDFTDLASAWLDFNRRVLFVANTSERSSIERLKDFDLLVSECLLLSSQYFSETCHFKLSKYQALIHWIYKDIEVARTLWEEIIRHNATDYSFWIEYITLEKYYGDVHKCEALFKRANSSISSGHEYLFSEWNAFEKCYGWDLSHLFTARQKTCSQILLLTQRQEKKAEKKARKNKLSEESDEKSFKKSKKTHSKQDRSTITSKLAFPSDDHNKKTLSSTNVLNSSWTVFVSNLPYKLTKEELQTFIENNIGPVKDVRLVMDNNNNQAGLCKGFAYVELASEGALTKALDSDRILFQGRPMFISKTLAQPTFLSHIKEGKDPCTLFVSNLTPSTTQGQLFELFSGFGEIKQIRLVTRKDGTSKGRAYVEFKDEASANQGIQIHNSLLDGRHISVQISDTSQSSKKSSKHKSLEKLPSFLFKPSSILAKQKPKSKVGLSHSTITSNTTISSTVISNNNNVSVKKTNSDFKKLYLK